MCAKIYQISKKVLALSRPHHCPSADYLVKVFSGGMLSKEWTKII